MKPLQKVVTAQDIESSLYYVHVDGAEDDKLRETWIREQNHQVSNGEANGDAPHGSIDGVPTKPLPASPQLALGDRPEPPPKVYPYYQPPAKGAKGSTQYGRQFAGYGTGSGTGSRRVDPEPSSISPAQTLLGPRPMHQRLRSADSAALGPVPERQNANLRRWSEQPTLTGTSLPPRPCIRRKDVSSNRSPDEFGPGPPLLPPGPNISRQEFHRSPHFMDLEATLEPSKITERAGHRFGDKGTSFTLIRRYDGFQWNVGKISNNVDEVFKGSNDVPGSQYDRNPGYINGAMSIEISTPGYSIFEGNKSQRDQFKATDLPRTSPNHEMLALEEGRGGQAMFRRQLQASCDETRPELRPVLNAINSSPNTHNSRPKFNLHRPSHESENTKVANPASPKSQRSKPPKTKHYVFRSPWDGICDFDVGVLGRSVKCKHTIAPATPDSKAGSRSVQVSELRFNLPSSKAFGPPPKSPSPNDTSRESKKSSFFSTQHRRHNSSFERYDSKGYDDDFDGDERMDLSLGQELAGGGFAGKQAKLGKLIIEDEGLKMLDLVVAANIGLWWKVYERVV